MSEPAETDTNGRTPRGQFAAGNEFGKLHKRRTRASELRGVLLQRLSPERLVAIADRLIGAAESGDMSAIRLCLGIVGKDKEGSVHETPEPRSFIRPRSSSPDHHWEKQKAAILAAGGPSAERLQRILDGVPDKSPGLDSVTTSGENQLGR